jgi:hypothetical protein
MISRITEVKALRNYSIFVSFSDGTQGTVSLEHLAHRGVFRAWDGNNLFERVHIDEGGAIAWNEDIDICPDNIYLQLRGITFEEWREEKN